MTSKVKLPYEFLNDMDEATLMATLGAEAESMKLDRKHQFASLNAVNDVLLYMRFAFGYQDCNLSYVNAFTAIAKHAPIQLAELPDMLNISRSTITRLVVYLAEGTTEGARPIVGLNYVKTLDDPRDSRRKIVALTPAGHMVARNVERLLRGGVTFERLKLEQQEHALAASKRTPN